MLLQSWFQETDLLPTSCWLLVVSTLPFLIQPQHLQNNRHRVYWTGHFPSKTHRQGPELTTFLVLITPSANHNRKNSTRTDGYQPLNHSLGRTVTQSTVTKHSEQQGQEHTLYCVFWHYNGKVPQGSLKQDLWISPQANTQDGIRVCCKNAPVTVFFSQLHKCALFSFYLITLWPSLIHSTLQNSLWPTTTEAASHHLDFVVEELGWSSEALESLGLLSGNSKNQQVFCIQEKAQETHSTCVVSTTICLKRLSYQILSQGRDQ